jgi:hypothetical protein
LTRAENGEGGPKGEGEDEPAAGELSQMGSVHEVLLDRSFQNMKNV